MENEIIIMPDGNRFSFKECLDNLKNTRDYALYLNTLFALKERYLIILSVKDTPAKISDGFLDILRAIGFSDVTSEHFRTYIGVLNCGEVVFDKSAEKAKTPMELSQTVADIELSVTSEHGKNGSSKIMINGEDHSMDCRGFNIVVYDPEIDSVIDSSTYDGYAEYPTFFHKLLWFDKQYIDEHFFLKEKYKKEWIDFYQKSLFSNRKPEHREISNGIIEPVIYDANGHGKGGVCDENFNFVAGHIKCAKNVWEITESYIPEDTNIEYIDETVIYAGNMINHPGHLIAESANEFMWWFFKNSEKKYRIAITYTNKFNGSPLKFIEELFDAYDISFSEVLVVEKPTKFSKVIVPDQAMYFGKWVRPYEFTYDFKSAYEKIKNNVKPAVFKKVYLTRSKAQKGNCIGEGYFINFYKKKGFEIINPEDYTLKEKAALMLGADEVVSTIGTSTHYAVFCKPDVKLTILSRTSDFHAPAQTIFNQVGNIRNVKIIDISAGFLHRDPTWEMFLLCVTDQFKEYVKKTYNEELDVTPEESLKSVVFEYLQNFPEYYANAPTAFNKLKNQKMLTVLQHLSEVFLGKEFDTTGLNTKTEEDKLKEQVKKLTADLDAAKKKIKALEGGEAYKAAKLIAETNTKLEKQIENMQTMLTTSSAANNNKKQDTEADLRKKIKKLQDQVSYYENSSSWKITKPLRAIAGFFRKLFGKGK